MPLLEKHLPFWAFSHAQLKSILIKNCVETFPKDIDPSTRKKLYELVTQTLTHNLGDDGFFTIAFGMFATILDDQNLTAANYKAAINHFRELPEVQDALLQMQEHIILQFRSPIAEDEEARGDDIPVPESLEAASESPSSIVDYPAIVMSSPLGCTPLHDALEGSDDPRISVFPPLAELSVTVSKAADHTYRPMTPKALFVVPFSSDMLQEGIEEWVEERYSPVDERVLSNHERRLRRLDSMARLLSLKMSLSACTAVALDLSAAPRIVIGANVSINGEQEKVFEAIASKLNIIQRFLTRISLDERKVIDSAHLDILANELASSLLANSSTTKDVLVQAARKIIHAICFDPETFTEREKRVFLLFGPGIVVLPLIADKAHYLQVRQLGADACAPTNFALPMVPAATHVREIHAEQLVVRYIFEELKVRAPLMVGISKLCCDTCIRYLQLYPLVTIRGTHGQIYTGVVNLADGYRPTEGSKRTGNTKYLASPYDTPERSLDAEDTIVRTPDTEPGPTINPAIHRRLSFGTPDAKVDSSTACIAGAGTATRSPARDTSSLGHSSPGSVYASGRPPLAPPHMDLGINRSGIPASHPTDYGFFHQKRHGDHLKPPTDIGVHKGVEAASEGERPLGLVKIPVVFY